VLSRMYCRSVVYLPKPPFPHAGRTSARYSAVLGSPAVATSERTGRGGAGRGGEGKDDGGGEERRRTSMRAENESRRGTTGGQPK